MARKTASAGVVEALNNWKTVTEVRHDLAMDDFNQQDSDTKAAIERIVKLLRVGANGYINLDGTPVKVEDNYLNMNLLYVAVEIVKNLAFMGYRVANFTFDPHTCAQCGVSIKGGTA